MMAVAAAGPASNFVLAAVGAVLLGLAMPAGVALGGDIEAGAALLVNGMGEPIWLATGLFYFILVNIFLGLFNLLPIPPFDGSHIVGGLLPKGLRAGWEKLQGIGMALVLGLVAISWVFGTSFLGDLLVRPVMWVMGLYLALADAIAALIA
jgi:Zn-dependent protease